MLRDGMTRRDFVRADVAVTGAALCAASGKPKQGGMPQGAIGGVKMSRLILGSNPMGGGAHARDLMYVSRLMKEYNTEERLLKLLENAEAEGIDTVLQGDRTLLDKYNKQRGGHMREIRMLTLPQDGAVDDEQVKEFFDRGLEQGAIAFYLFGDSGDYLARNGRVDAIEKALGIAKKMGALLGIGGHGLDVVLQCEKQGLKPAFYVKTFHNDNYWSATPRENRKPFCWYDGKGGNSYSGKTGDHNYFHDNIWCLDAEETMRVMSKVKAPWVAFKVLAAGAIHPSEGFSFAFENGADFIAVGMFDYQVRENAEIARAALARHKDRTSRLWRA